MTENLIKMIETMATSNEENRNSVNTAGWMAEIGWKKKKKKKKI